MNDDYYTMKEVFDRIRALERRVTELESIAFFCDGNPKSIKLGFTLKDIPLLAETIAVACKDSKVQIVLNAPTTAHSTYWLKNKLNTADRVEKTIQANDGFCMVLCNELMKLDIKSEIIIYDVQSKTVVKSNNDSVQRINF